MIKVIFSEERLDRIHAPGMVLARPVARKVYRAMLARAYQNGKPQGFDDKVVLLSDEDARQSLSARQWRELESWGEVTVLMDPWEFAHFYGYDAHTAFEVRSK